ncbi:MAG TPA: flagellar motor switch protein FliG [Terriglobales bacterium]|nr:flagellar motor switch protein FliG [Terriglobales bacterium]
MPATATSGISGTRKAAILLAVLGEEASSAVFRHLSEKDVQVVTKELAEMGRVSADTAKQILEEYSQLVLTQDYLAQGGIELATRLLVKAFGNEDAKNLLQKVVRLQELSASKLDSLQNADPQQLAKFLEGEHPQTIALVLAHLDGKPASSLLMKLPEQSRAEVVKRLAQLRQFSPEMAEKVSVVLNRRLQSLGEQRRKTYAGFKSVADLVNRLDAGSAKEILAAIESEDPKLAINIRNLMFTFDDLLSVPDVAIREWLGAMDKKTLALSLKGASADLKNHIFRAMSSRAVEMLKEDMEALGPVRAKEVAQAQQEAVAVIRRLESEGKVTLKTEGDDEYIV